MIGSYFRCQFSFVEISRQLWAVIITSYRDVHHHTTVPLVWLVFHSLRVGRVSFTILLNLFESNPTCTTTVTSLDWIISSVRSFVSCSMLPTNEKQSVPGCELDKTNNN